MCYTYTQLPYHKTFLQTIFFFFFERKGYTYRKSEWKAAIVKTGVTLSSD